MTREQKQKADALVREMNDIEMSLFNLSDITDKHRLYLKIESDGPIVISERLKMDILSMVEKDYTERLVQCKKEFELL